MELPQPSHPFAAEGRKATHDFLSLYGLSPQDPRPSSQGGYLKTHNFLQPLEKEDECSVKADNTDVINAEKPPPSAPPPVEQVLPGGITYSISHVSFLNPRMPKSEGTAFNMAPAISNNDRNGNPNCSAYNAGRSFNLWDGSSIRKGKTGKENLCDLNVAKEPMMRTGQWPIERPSESSSSHLNSFSSRSSSQPPPQKNQSFDQMLISAKVPYAKEEDEDNVTTLRKEGNNSQRGELRIKVDGKASNDRKANTPRSKHSATEQRRRCKINDRFQMLRELIPHSDQKRDKASFLLDVIEYIQFLQEKVSRYEGYPGSSNEPSKLTPWRSGLNLADSSADQPRAPNRPMLMFKPDDKNNVVTPNLSRKQQNPAEPDTKNPISFKAMDHQAVLINKASSVPIPRLQTDIFPSLRNNNAVVQPACRLGVLDADNASLPQLKFWQSRPCLSALNSGMNNQEELAVEGGTNSISSMYSEGLLNTLTQALKSSGVDVSQASISVQVDIGKRTNPAQNALKTSKDIDINSDSRTLVQERVESSHSNQTTKRIKTLKS